LTGSPGTRLSKAQRSALHAELWSVAVERMRLFSLLVALVHVPLLIRDLTVDASALPPAESRWQAWLFALHVVIELASVTSFVLLGRGRSPRVRSAAAYSMTFTLLVWSGWLSGVDQLIGAGITVFSIVNLGSALFVTFETRWTLLAFASGLATFVGGQLYFSESPSLTFSQLVNGLSFSIACLFFSRMIYVGKATAFIQRVTIAKQRSELEQANRRLDAERKKADRLLDAVLPARIADRLRGGETRIADSHRDVTVLLADLVGFTRLASELSAREMVDLLDALFSEFDAIASRYELEKIKTVGDAYLAVRGIVSPSNLDVVAAADAALAMQAAAARFGDARGRPLAMRIGLARGEVVAGVLGRERLLYDLWGDAVNVASRLETSARGGEILVTDGVAALLEATHELGLPSLRELKGKGEVGVRSLRGRRAQLGADDSVFQNSSSRIA
jgi:class 3 adenylate cyclase